MPRALGKVTAISSSKEPEVSIIVPTRDRHERLPRTLLTALGQRHVDAEIIVVDDGSNPPVAPRLADAAKKQIQVIRHEQPTGVAEARNTGLRQARGAWTAFLDDDDLWAPAKLRRQLDAAAGARLDFAFSAALAIEAGGNVAYTTDVPESGIDVHRELLTWNLVPGGCSNLIARTNLVRAVGGFDPAFSVLADWDLNIRLSAAGAAATVTQQLVAYALHEDNMHMSEAGLADELGRFDHKHGVARGRLGVGLDRAWWLSGRADTRRRAGDTRGEAAALFELARVTGRPAIAARAILLRLGARRALAAMGRGRRRFSGVRYEPAPQWVLRALDPPEADLRALWR